MQAKYVFLHCSYSAPVRVSDIENVLSDAARGITLTLFFFSRVVWVERVGCCLFPVGCDEDAGRGAGDSVRAVITIGREVVLIRFWAGCFPADERDVAVPSRTAPLAMPMQASRFAVKNRIFFISGESVANLYFFLQVNNVSFFCVIFIFFSCCKNLKNDIICRLPVRIWRNW